MPVQTPIWYDQGGEIAKLSRDKINVAMAREALTITNLAEKYGVSRARMNVILNNREVIAIYAERIANGLGVDVTETLED